VTEEDLLLKEGDPDPLNAARHPHVIVGDLLGEIHLRKKAADQALHHQSDLLAPEMVWMIGNVHHLEETDLLAENLLAQTLLRLV